MNVKEFVEKYTAAKDATAKNKILKSINIKTYIPYSAKVVHAQVMLDKGAERVNGVLMVNSPARFLG